MISDEQLHLLRRDARSQRDEKVVALCTEALAGDETAREICRRLHENGPDLDPMTNRS